MKKLLLIIGIIVLTSLSAFTTPEKEEKKKEDKKTENTTKNTTETKPVLDNKFKDDIQGSVLEFMKDMKVNPDTCYIPFKK